MLRTIVWKELTEQLLSLRFAVGFALLLALFAVGGFAWNAHYAQAVAQFRAGEQEATAEIEKKANRGLFNLSWGGETWRPPSPAGFLSGGYSRGLPNVARVSAFQVSRLEPRGDRNPLLFRRNLDWGFILGLLGTLLALLLTYDGIAGEKERGSLRQTLANQLPRNTLLWGKYLASMAAIAAPVLVGSALSLLIIAAGNIGGLPAGVWGPAMGVVGGGLVCISAFVWLGLFVSARTTNSSFALLVLLMIWALLAVFIPSSGGMIGGRLVRVPRASDIERQIEEIAFRSGMADGPEREEKTRAVREDYWRQLVRQMEMAQQATQCSPVAAYHYLGEAICATGVLRFRAFIAQAEQYRRRLHDFVEQEDAKDPKSNHRLIPGHSRTISQQPVRPEAIPRFTFREASLDERSGQALRSVVVLLIYNLIFFAGASWSFRRYDVR